MRLHAPVYDERRCGDPLIADVSVGVQEREHLCLFVNSHSPVSVAAPGEVPPPLL
jgi:hypothetical protein